MGCAVGSVTVVLHAISFNVDRDIDADGFVAVLGTSAFVGTFFGDVRVVLHATNLDVDGNRCRWRRHGNGGVCSCFWYFWIGFDIFQ